MRRFQHHRLRAADVARRALQSVGHSEITLMHETSLVKNLLKHIDAVAVERGAQRVVGVSVWLGALSHLSANHFMEHFQIAAAGTIAEHARVEIEVSDDAWHANAQDVLLRSVEVET